TAASGGSSRSSASLRRHLIGLFYIRVFRGRRNLDLRDFLRNLPRWDQDVVRDRFRLFDVRRCFRRTRACRGGRGWRRGWGGGALRHEGANLVLRIHLMRRRRAKKNDRRDKDSVQNQGGD